jgi:hypothetical protein
MVIMAVPIKIVLGPKIRIPIYQKLSGKVKQLYHLGMTFLATAESYLKGILCSPIQDK